MKCGNYLMHYQDGVIYSYRTPIAVISGSNLFLNTHSSSGYTSRHIWSVGGIMHSILRDRYTLRKFFMYYNDPADEYCTENCLEGSGVYDEIMRDGFDRNDVVQLIAAQLVLRLPSYPVSRHRNCSDYIEIGNADYAAMPCKKLDRATKEIEKVFATLSAACDAKKQSGGSMKGLRNLNMIVARSVIEPLKQIVTDPSFKYKPWNL